MQKSKYKTEEQELIRELTIITRITLIVLNSKCKSQSAKPKSKSLFTNFRESRRFAQIKKHTFCHSNMFLAGDTLWVIKVKYPQIA